MKRKMMAGFLAFTMLLTLCACGDSGQSTPGPVSTSGTTDTMSSTPMEYTGDSITWDFDGGSGLLTISGYGDMGDMGDYSGVTPWIEYQGAIEAVIIEDTVTSIGNFAFADCVKLTTITIPASVKNIGVGAFSRCEILTDIYYGGTQEEWTGMWGLGVDEWINGDEILTVFANTGEIDAEVVHATIHLNDNTQLTVRSSGAIFWDYPALNNTSRDMIIADAISFSEERAWISIASSQQANDRHIMLIDTSGSVLFYRYDENGDVRYSNFAQGVSLLCDRSSEDVLLINTSGEIVWSLKENGVTDAERLYGKGSVESISLQIYSDRSNLLDYYDNRLTEFNGLFLESIEINTFEKTGTIYTIVKPDGTWLFDPVENQVNSKRKEGCPKCYCWYFNGYPEAAGTEYPVTFTNLFSGESLTVSMTEYDVRFNAENNIEAVAKWQEEYERSYQDGLLYNRELNGFTDASGNVVIDCSGYDIETGDYFLPQFHNGYCVLPIYNPDKARYLTVIDNSGNQLFAPVKRIHRFGVVSDGYFLMTNDSDSLYYQYKPIENENEGKAYYTLDGNAIMADYEEIYPFSDGYSLVVADTYSPLLSYNHSKTCYFLDTNLNGAFPQSKPSGAQGTGILQPVSKSYMTIRDFSIEGKWKSSGADGFGQAQPGAIIAFDGTNCNFFSPKDTYAFFADGDNYKLECTSFMSTDTLSFTVKIVDKNSIDIYYGNTVTELQRIE